MKKRLSIVSSDFDTADVIDDNTTATSPSATRRNSNEVSSTLTTKQGSDEKFDTENTTDGRLSADSTGRRSRVDSSTPKDKPLKSALRAPSAAKKPSIVGIVGARRVGVKWRMLIRNGGSGVVDDAEEEEKQVEVVNKSYKDRVDAVLMSNDATMLTQAPSRRAKETEVSEDVDPKAVGGMRQFGINKGVISRAIVKFASPPEPHPLTICFHFPGTFLTHHYVLDMVRSKLQILEANDNAENVVGKVSTIQFIDRNTIHGTQGMDNRWLVTLANFDCVEVLIEQGLHLFNRKIAIKRYDEILNEEYAEYLEYRNHTNKLYAKNENETSGGEISTAVAKDDVTDLDDEDEFVTNQSSDIPPTALEALHEEENESY